jgi:uncharacterized membrane protein
MSAASGAAAPPAARWAAYLSTRLVELLLIAIGIGFTAGSGRAAVEARYLVAWDLLAVFYLVTGIVVLRRRRRAAPSAMTGGAGGAAPGGLGASRALRLLASPRFNFGFTLAASIVGMTSAFVVISHGSAAGAGRDIRLYGTLAIGCAWVLLHAGYARFYAGLYYRASAPARPGEGAGAGGGLEFPRCEHPGPDDFMYFSFTLGTSFAVSDVSVTSPSLRWHVMMHSVLSFFYNAIVLALAIAVLTGR